jgi:hypothetical protein
MAPNPESAAAAVETLRAELDMIDNALDSIDRKAALIPAVLGAITGIFIAPDTTFTGLQQVLLPVALGTGIVSIVLAIAVLWARFISAGPHAQTTAEGTHLTPAEFNRAVAGSLANSVDAMSALAQSKGARLNQSMLLAACTIVLLAVVRVTGGMT